MARRIDEAVAVRVDQQVVAGGAPASFIWRDRVYVVREVLGYWRERRAWWNASTVRAVHGDEPSPASSRSAAVNSAEPGVVPAAEGLRVAVDREREVWRVEARGPRTVGAGVYDISREISSAAPGGAPGVSGAGGPEAAWHLLAVAD